MWEGNDQVEGVRQYFDYLETKRYKLHVRVLLSRYRSPATCPTCHGSRLKPAARFVKLAGYDFVQLNELTIEVAAPGFNAWPCLHSMQTLPKISSANCRPS